MPRPILARLPYHAIIPQNRIRKGCPSSKTGPNVRTMSARDGAVASATAAPLKTRGRLLTAVVLKIDGSPDGAFYGALDELIRKSPQFFASAPLVLDIGQAEGLADRNVLQGLTQDLRARDLHPIGVQNASAAQSEAASGAGLMVLQSGRDAPLDHAPRPAPAKPKAVEPAPAAEPVAAPAPATVTITRPVRSGQSVVNEHGDLIVLAPVSSGAELIARGNIHVYGSLRGRALAGVHGDETARIFCQSLEAELVAIAGLYKTSEDIGAAVSRRRVQIFLQNDALSIEALR